MKSLYRLEGLEKQIDRMLAVGSTGQTAQSQRAEPAETLLEFIPRLSPMYEAPHHLAKVADLFHRAIAGEQVQCVISVPPRHGKTETLSHGITWSLVNRPGLEIAYLSSTAALARKKSGQVRSLARRAGVKISQDSSSKSDWRTTTEKGGLWSVGVGGQVNGEGFSLCIVDDPHKSRSEAESPIIRDKVYDWFKGDVYNRLEPKASIIVCHTRWHPDDLAGRLLNEGWENIHLPAIDQYGKALWPQRWPIDALLKRQEDLGGPQGYDWVSLYQGEPRPDGTALFQGSYTWIKKPPLELCRIVIGVDFGYTRRGDYSVAIVLAEFDGQFYVLDCFRDHLEPRQFRAQVQRLSKQYGNAPVTAYCAATEAGNVEFLRDGGLQVQMKRAVVDKLSNAVHVSADWNTGKVLCPVSGLETHWVQNFLAEVKGFTGKGDRHDDQVDALAAAHDSLRVHHVDWEYLEKLSGAWPRPYSF